MEVSRACRELLIFASTGKIISHQLLVWMNVSLRYCCACLQGEFKSIMAIVTSCRSDMSPQGLGRHAHLADGWMHLVLVHKCSILQYLKFLSLIPTCGRRLTPPKPAHYAVPQIHATDPR